ncbi:hypothetical protein GW17_00009850 [Ensete ventricosum]|nr:hypothetical protein GW17_00009850 [Ensete ventricosum]
MMATARCSGRANAGEEAVRVEEESSGSNSGCGNKPPWSSSASESKAKLFQEWNRAFLLVCAGGLFVDPLFFYALSISPTCMCVFIDGWFAVTVTVLRCTNDAVHLLNLWLQVRTAAHDAAERSSASADEEGCKAIAKVRRLSCLKSVLFDLFVILPVPQVVMWIVAPALIRRGMTTTVMTVFLIVFLLQYLPKIYHAFCFLRRLQNLLGYIFGTIWGGIALNLIAYFVASHAAGACWYLLGIQRATKCLNQQCMAMEGCALRTVACTEPLYYGVTEKQRLAWAENNSARSTCLDSGDNFEYGAYKWTVALVTNPSRQHLRFSTFGTIESTTEWLEIVFNIVIVTSGLLLVTALIGNIKHVGEWDPAAQVFLHATTSKKQALHLRIRSLEWWMRRRHLPRGFRQRVRQYERQRWAAMRGVDECEVTRNLPEGLRRDIKYHLCLDLVRQVPLFQHMDELVLENICDRVKSLIFPKGETVRCHYLELARLLFFSCGSCL